VSRFVSLVAVLVCALAAAATACAGTSAQPSLQDAVQQTLARDRLALASLQRAQSRHALLLRRAQAQLLVASDPFPAQDEAARLQEALAVDAAGLARLARSIRGLELALRPVAVPVRLASGPPSSLGAFAVGIAERYLGVRYLWGGTNPDTGFDCSGFVRYVYEQLGVYLPHYAATQYATTTHVDPAQLEPGDLVFFEPRADGPGHVGMYVGNDVFIEAPQTGDVVKLYHVSTEARQIGFVGATRPGA
jgi:peptidoglycan DL-endopeptidase CwlO